MAALNISTATARRTAAAVAGLIAASLVDAAFVDPEPGASVASHLLWASTMLALLAAVAVAIRRLARGVRLSGGVLASLTRAEHAAGAAWPAAAQAA
jgi:cytochrome c-type biogenesis protein CcmH/NrfF